MSTSLGITRPNGVRLPVYYTASQDKMALVMGQLSDWEDFCNQNWLSDNHEDINCSENRVKAFLNG